MYFPSAFHINKACHRDNIFPSFRCPNGQAIDIVNIFLVDGKCRWYCCLNQPVLCTWKTKTTAPIQKYWPSVMENRSALIWHHLTGDMLFGAKICKYLTTGGYMQIEYLYISHEYQIPARHMSHCDRGKVSRCSKMSSGAKCPKKSQRVLVAGWTLHNSRLFFNLKKNVWEKRFFFFFCCCCCCCCKMSWL